MNILGSFLNIKRLLDKLLIKVKRFVYLELKKRIAHRIETSKDDLGVLESAYEKFLFTSFSTIK